MSTPPLALDETELNRWLETQATVAGIEITAQQRDGVRANLRVAAAMAELVLAVPLDPRELDLAPVFVPRAPDT